MSGWSRTSLAVLAVAAGLCLLALAAFLTADRGAVRAAEEERLPGVSGGEDARALEVDAVAVRRAPARARAELRSLLKPARRVELAAEVEGRVTEVATEEHAHVEAEAVLVRLDRTLLLAAAKRAEAVVLRTRAAHRLAELELTRQRDLAERAVASAAELDRAESQERTTWAAAQEARAQLDDARARLEKAVIRAPFAGVVNWLDLEVGAYLRPGDRVAELLDLSEIELEVGLSDRQIIALRGGDPVVLEVDVFPGEAFEGRIDRIGRAADARTQQYPVEVRVPNPGERLLPGMVGRIRLEIGDASPAIHVPRRAIQREFEIDYLFVLERDAAGVTASRRRVVTRAVPFRPDLLEVMEGVEAGDLVAVSRVRELRTGQRVRVRRTDGDDGERSG